MNPLIKKADGTEEAFQPEKLRYSLTRSGASEASIEEVLKKITSEINDGDSTGQIYRKAFGLLKKLEKPAASRYSLKRAVLSLGPTGFPFEVFVARIFEEKGYRVRVGEVLDGKCTTHEVDLVARKENECIFGELKFHNRAGTKSDVQVALYVYARFHDLQEGVAVPKGCRATGLLLTNTKFTKNTIHYSKCAGLEVISWSHPREGNLQDLIEETKVYPLTCLTSLSNKEKLHLLEKNVVLSKALKEKRQEMKEAGLSDKKIAEALEEADVLCRAS
ncbi:MAG: ATPase [Candidatus Paceibacterota bacterium]